MDAATVNGTVFKERSIRSRSADRDKSRFALTIFEKVVTDDRRVSTPSNVDAVVVVSDERVTKLLPVDRINSLKTNNEEIKDAEPPENFDAVLTIFSENILRQRPANIT